MRRIYYFDHHATTPCHPAVVEAMLPWFSEKFGNPSSLTHAFGREAASAVETSRATVARLLGVDSTEVFFTSGATESNNIALSIAGPADHVVTSAVEHRSILAPVERLEKSGTRVSRIAPDGNGVVSVDAVLSAIRADTRLVSIQAANGEVGALQPIAEIAAACRDRGVTFHTDATQAIGRVPLDLRSCDLVSLSAHKFYGPKGVGVLVSGRRVLIPSPPQLGGGQEKGLRAGTVNVPGVVGLVTALELTMRSMVEEGARLSRLSDRLRDQIAARIKGVHFHGPEGVRLPGNRNVSFERVEAEALMMSLRRFALSSGSACSSGDREPSHVLRAMGVDDEVARGSVRIGLGRDNDEEQVDLLMADLEIAVARLREIVHG